MTSRPILLVVAIAAAGAALEAQLPDAWRHWQYVAPVELPAGDGPGFVSVLVPESVTAEAAPGWIDLRVIDETGREVPYVLEARVEGDRREWRAARRLDTGFVPGAYSQVVLDLGDAPGIHSAMVMDLGGTDDLQASVEIAVSDDGREWRIAAERVPIFRLREAGRGERTDVAYPPSQARYVRVRLLDAGRPVEIDGAQVAHEITMPPERVPANVPLSPVADAGTANDRQTVWLSAPGVPVPLTEVRWETATPQFLRQVTVEVADERDRWRRVASGEIRRAPETAGRPLSLVFPEVTGSRWRVTVHHGNDPPIADLAPVLYTTPRRVVFRQEPGRTYRLLYGHARPRAPQYDLARLTPAEALAAAAPAALGPAVAHTGFVDATPWTERHPAVVWVAIGAAVLLLGVLAVRTLRS